MNTVQQVIILSAELDTNRPEKNRQLTENLAACIDDCNFRAKRATGVYKGKEETSFVVIVNNETDIDTLKGLAFNTFGQESVLHQDANQEAHLVFSDGTSERLGRLEQVTREEAIKHDAFTIMNNEYYLTVDRK